MYENRGPRNAVCDGLESRLREYVSSEARLVLLHLIEKTRASTRQPVRLTLRQKRCFLFSLAEGSSQFCSHNFDTWQWEVQRKEEEIGRLKRKEERKAFAGWVAWEGASQRGNEWSWFLLWWQMSFLQCPQSSPVGKGWGAESDLCADVGKAAS